MMRLLRVALALSLLPVTQGHGFFDIVRRFLRRLFRKG